MKTISLCLLLSFTALIVKAQTYNYIPFPDSNTAWVGYDKYCSHGNPCFVLSRWTYQITGDTTINNLIYHKLSSGDYIREDSNKRVFHVPEYDTLFQERVMYDFSLSLGDTFVFLPPLFLVIEKIDTPVYHGIPRRTLHLRHVNDKWIEGIGSTYTPIFYGIYNTRWPQVCEVYQDSVLIYSNSGDPYCVSYNDISEQVRYESLTISPNPADNEIVITSLLPTKNLAIYNLMGVAVKEMEVGNESEVRINVTDLPSGIYVLRALFNKAETYTKKVLVQH